MATTQMEIVNNLSPSRARWAGFSLHCHLRNSKNYCNSNAFLLLVDRAELVASVQSKKVLRGDGSLEFYYIILVLT